MTFDRGFVKDTLSGGEASRVGGIGLLIRAKLIKAAPVGGSFSNLVYFWFI